MKHLCQKARISAYCACAVSLSLLTGCSTQKNGEMHVVRGGISAVYTLEELQRALVPAQERPGALLGVYLSEFLSRGTSLVVGSALAGVEADIFITAPPAIDDEDFTLLQAFGDALQVDVPELLNRSPRREESLNAYIDALRNVGQRAGNRFEEVEEALDTVRDRYREKQREVSAMRRTLQTAIRNENFAEAGSLQRDVNEAEAELSEIELRRTQTEHIHRTYRDLLDIFRRRLLALESNREALITGIRVVDVPTVETLDILDRPSRTQRRDGLQLLNPGGSFDAPRLGQ